MRQVSTLILSIIFLNLAFIQPSYSIVRGGIDYSIPIDYSKLSEPELESKARVYFFNAMNYKDKEENEDMTNALMLYSVLQNLNPEVVDYSIKLGILYDKLGKDRFAKGNFSRAMNINYNNPVPYFYFGEFYYKRQMYRLALKYYNKAYSLGYENNYDTLFKLGDIYQKLGDTQSALKYLRKAFEQSPNDDLNNKIMLLEDKDSTNQVYSRSKS